MTMLWTRQDIKSLNDLKSQGLYRVKKEYLEQQFEEVSSYVIKLYRWFTKVASEIVEKPIDVDFPIWCSISEKNMLKPIENTVVFVLEVDESDIIYFDGAKWDYVLNHLYIPKDENDANQYQADLESKGFHDRFSFIEGKYSNFYPIEKKKVMDSWVRIFEIDNWNIFKVQANIWEIKPEMIKEIIYYNK